MSSDESLFLFIDGSVNTKSGVGYGAYLLVSSLNEGTDYSQLIVKSKKFENTSSTKLELQTFIWAFEENNSVSKKITVFTDSQNLVGLIDRRIKLESDSFISKKGNILSNADLYRIIFNILDNHECVFIKVKGHKPSNAKSKTDMLFSIVDKESRRLNRLNSPK